MFEAVTTTFVFEQGCELQIEGRSGRKMLNGHKIASNTGIPGHITDPIAIAAWLRSQFPYAFRPAESRSADGLLPCPFCGGDAHLSPSDPEKYGYHCSNAACGVSPEQKDTVQEAIAAWNLRTAEHDGGAYLDANQVIVLRQILAKGRVDKNEGRTMLEAIGWPDGAPLPEWFK